MGPLVMSLGVFAAGLVLLVAGGRLLVDGSVAIATRLRVAPLLIGLTIVAWGTSAPELAFNTVAASQGRTGLVFGNVVGANICNMALILGFCAAVLRPLKVHADVIRRELPVMAGVLVLVPALVLVSSALGQGQGLTRVGGAVLVAAFGAYSAFVIVQGMKARAGAPPPEGAPGLEKAGEGQDGGRSMPAAAGLVAGGLVALGIGGSLAADGAVGIATALGVPATIVGLTIVSIGTTLPELITGITAVRRGHTDLAVGNVVGSCTFNAGAILGLATIIAPAPLPPGGWVALAVMCGTALMLLPISLTFNRHISRGEGVLLLAVYALFLAYQTLAALSGGGAG